MKTRYFVNMLVLCALMLVQAGPAEAGKNSGKWRKKISHVEREIEGWTVHVDKKLFKEEKELGEKALKLLSAKLYEMTLFVPEGPLEKMKEAPIWLDADHELGGMQFHPDAKWLKEHGYDTDMAKCVHIPRAAGFINVQHEMKQPWAILHELAHAYHFRDIEDGFENKEILAAYNNAVKSGKYEKSLLITGKRVRHYGLTDQKEYFAESTESYLAVNDFYPFVRAELKEHDPEMYEIMKKIWAR